MGIVDDLSNAAKNFNPDSIFSIFNSGALASFYFYLKILFNMVLVLGLGVVVWKYWFQYKVKVTVIKRFGQKGEEVIFDHAKIVKDKQGKRTLQLMKTRDGKNRVTCPIPQAEYRGKAGKKDHYFVYIDDNFQLHPSPFQLDPKNPRLRVFPQERQAWARWKEKDLVEKYKKKDMWDKYLPAGLLMMAMITAFLIWFFASKELGGGLKDLAGQFAQVASSCTKLR